MIDPLLLAKAYAQVWAHEFATTSWGGMILHSRHPLSMQSEEPAPHIFSRRSILLADDPVNDEEKYDRNIIWRVEFHFWGEQRDQYGTQYDRARSLNRSNATLVTAVDRGVIVQDIGSRERQPLEPRHFEMVRYTGDLEQICHDLFIMKLYVK